MLYLNMVNLSVNSSVSDADRPAAGAGVASTLELLKNLINQKEQTINQQADLISQQTSEIAYLHLHFSPVIGFGKIMFIPSMPTSKMLLPG